MIVLPVVFILLFYGSGLTLRISKLGDLDRRELLIALETQNEESKVCIKGLLGFSLCL